MSFGEFGKLDGNVIDIIVLEANGLLNKVGGLDVKVGGGQVNEFKKMASSSDQTGDNKPVDSCKVWIDDLEPPFVLIIALAVFDVGMNAAAKPGANGTAIVYFRTGLSSKE